MIRLIAVAVSISFLAASAAPPRHAIYLKPTLKKTRDRKVAASLEECVDDFRESKSQIGFLDADSEQAELAYLHFIVKQKKRRDSTDLWLTSSVRIAGAKAVPIPSACKACDLGTMRRLFLHIIEQTLFRPDGGLYAPLRLQTCTELKGQNTVRLTIQPPSNGIGFDGGIRYSLRRFSGTRETGVDFTRNPIGATDLTATFTFDGPSSPASIFMTACRSGQVANYELVPHAQDPGDDTTVNIDAFSPHI
jgi:hypothetical protein